MGYKWKPSKSAKRAFAQKMDEIDDYCAAHGISSSATNDSYYFTINGQALKNVKSSLNYNDEYKVIQVLLN